MTLSGAGIRLPLWGSSILRSKFVNAINLPWGGSYRGLLGLRDFFTKLLSNVDSQLDRNEFVDAGDDVVMIGRTRGTTKAKGTPFDVAAIHVWTVRNGKIVAFHPYIDTPAMLKVLAA
jgi:ketosteroid isomerase-like protein